MPHTISTRNNLAVLAVLLILALATWGVAYIDLKRWNLVMAMTVAVIKMMLVVLIFMHGWWMPRLSKLAFAAGLFWLVIMIGLTLSDYLSRSLFPSVELFPPRSSPVAP